MSSAPTTASTFTRFSSARAWWHVAVRGCGFVGHTATASAASNTQPEQPGGGAFIAAGHGEGYVVLAA